MIIRAGASYFSARHSSHLILGLVLLGLQAAAQQAKHDDASNGFAQISAAAEAAREASRLEDARLLYKKALALRPQWAEGWWSLGTVEYDRNSYTAAANAFQKVVSLAHSNGTAFAMLGLSEFELGRDSLAFKHLQKAAGLGLSADPDLQHVVMYHEGILFQRQGRFQSAREMLEQLCLQGVSSHEVVTGLGMTLLRKRGRDTPPQGSADAQIVTNVGRGACLAGQRKFDDAREELRKVVADNPKYPGIHYAFGLVLVDASDNPDAIAEFKSEIANNPDDVAAHLQIAVASYKNDSSNGLPYAEQAVKMVPREPFAHYVLGMLLLDADQAQRAIPELETAKKAFPDDTRIYLALGTAYSRVGRREDATRARSTFQRLTEQGKRSDADALPGVGSALDGRRVDGGPSSQ